MNFINTLIGTERLKLIPITEDFSNEIFKEFTSEIAKYMSPKTPKKIEETVEFIKSARNKMKKGEELQVVILNKNNNEFLGLAGIHKISSRTPEPGIWIKKDAQGNKYGLEAVKALREWVDENLEYEFIRYPVFKKNAGSRNIAESLGGVIKKENKDKKNGKGELFDEVEYWIYPKT